MFCFPVMESSFCLPMKKSSQFQHLGPLGSVQAIFVWKKKDLMQRVVWKMI